MSYVKDIFGGGILADRPASLNVKQEGYNYYAADTFQLFRWNGSSWDEVLTGGGVTSSDLTNYLSKAGNLSGLANVGTARTNLGLGTMAVEDAVDYQAVSEKGNANGYASLDSGGKIPTSQLPAGISGGLSYQGTWNANTNSPTLTSATGTNGQYYRVSTAGTTSIDGISDWAVGDWIIFNGSNWQKIDNTDAVTSVAGRTGSVTLANTDISGLGTMATETASDYLSKAGNLSGLANAGTARTNLGLGNAATKNTGTTSADVAAGDDSRITGAAQKANNLSDLASAATARTNLGLGTVALTDAATIATDASLGTVFTVTLGGNRTLGAPTNPTDGRKCIWRFTQDGSGSRTITLTSGTDGFALGADITSVTLSTAAGKVDYMGAIYSSASQRWHVVAFVKGF